MLVSGKKTTAGAITTACRHLSGQTQVLNPATLLPDADIKTGVLTSSPNTVPTVSSSLLHIYAIYLFSGDGEREEGGGRKNEGEEGTRKR